MHDGLIASVLALASPANAAEAAVETAATLPAPADAGAAAPLDDAGSYYAARANAAPAVYTLQDEEPRPPSHTFELYGFIQMDAIQDFDRVDPNWDATLRPSRIPTEEGIFGDDGQNLISVRQSRAGIRGTGELANRPYEFRLEADLFGTGVDEGQTTFRLRHAYARWGPILAGQTHSLFMDIDLFPNVIDYWGPTGMVFLRNPQIRFTFVNSGGWEAAIALEKPGNDIDTGNIRLIDEDLATNIQNDEELPDFTAMLRYGGDWGHVQLSGILRKVGFETRGTPGNEPTGSELGWGLMGAGVFRWSIATFRLGVVYGEGIASYLNDGGMDLAPSAALIPAPPIFPPPPLPPLNQLLDAEAVPLLGITAYVDLQWSPTLSSSIGYSLTEVDNTNFQAATAYHRGEYASANLLWAPHQRILTGLEMLWGQRTDNDGDTGEDVRAQLSFKLSFSSNDLWGH